MVGESMFNAILFIFYFWLGEKIPSNLPKEKGYLMNIIVTRGI